MEHPWTIQLPSHDSAEEAVTWLKDEHDVEATHADTLTISGDVDEQLVNDLTSRFGGTILEKPTGVRA